MQNVLYVYLLYTFSPIPNRSTIFIVFMVLKKKGWLDPCWRGYHCRPHGLRHRLLPTFITGSAKGAWFCWWGHLNVWPNDPQIVSTYNVLFCPLDSKTLTEEKREQLVGVVEKNSSFLGWMVELIPPSVISGHMLDVWVQSSALALLSCNTCTQFTFPLFYVQC